MTASRAPGSSRRACAASARAPPCGEALPAGGERGQGRVGAGHEDHDPAGGGQVPEDFDGLTRAVRVEPEQVLVAQARQGAGQRRVTGAGRGGGRPGDRRRAGGVAGGQRRRGERGQ